MDDEKFFVNYQEIDLSDNTYLGNVHTTDELPSMPSDKEYRNIWGKETLEVEDIVKGTVDPDLYDKFINAEISIWNKGVEKSGHIVKQVRGNDGQLIGRRHLDGMFNPKMGTWEYIIEFEDGTSD